jgi:hypothetical protein
MTPCAFCVAHQSRHTPQARATCTTHATTPQHRDMSGCCSVAPLAKGMSSQLTRVNHQQTLCRPCHVCHGTQCVSASQLVTCMASAATQDSRAHDQTPPAMTALHCIAQQPNNNPLSHHCRTESMQAEEFQLAARSSSECTADVQVVLPGCMLRNLPSQPDSVHALVRLPSAKTWAAAVPTTTWSLV